MIPRNICHHIAFRSGSWSFFNTQGQCLTGSGRIKTNMFCLANKGCMTWLKTRGNPISIFMAWQTTIVNNSHQELAF